MGLTLALNTALTGLNTSQEMLSVISNNISNANTENYARRVAKQVSVSVDGKGAGAAIEAITRQIDDFLLDAVREQGSVVAQSEVVNEYYTRIQTLLGQPDTASSLSSAIDKFFSSLQSLSTNPELSSLRLNALNDAKSLVSKISGLANTLEEMRFQADRDLYSSVNFINQKLRELHDLNPAIRISSIASGTPDPELVERRDNALRELSKQLDISIYYRETGEVTIATANGLSILDENLHQLSYIPASSTSTFTNNTALNPVTIQTLKADGTVTGVSEILITAGVESSVINKISGGKLLGYTQIRDNIIPNLLDQLDNLAYTLTDQFNAIHNDGAGFPPPSSFTGITPVLASDEHLFSGSVRIGLVNPDGTPVQSFYSDETYLRPLTLDLASLDNGEGNSRPDIQTIIDEINNYYGSPRQRVSVGPLYDIRIASRTDTIGLQASFPTNSTFTFDLELDNSSSGNTSVEVQSVQVLNAGATGLVSGLPSATTLSGGERSRTGASNAITVDFNGVATNGPYTIQLSVKVTDENGLEYYTDITYRVDNNVSGIFNDRYEAQALVSGDGTIIPPGTSQPYLVASLVNADGNTPAAGEPGFLKITTNANSGDYRIAIDELDSKELGQPENSKLFPASNRGFSHFFGLNNFFVENRVTPTTANTTTVNSALNFSIRSDILTDPNRISLGELTQTAIKEPVRKPISVGTISASATLNFSANTVAGDQITINGTVFTFVGAPTVNPNEIEVGATLAQTLTNIVSVLNATNAYTQDNVENATYTDNGSNSLVITFDRKGTIGNTFGLSFDLSTSGSTASINGATATILSSGALQGGQNEITYIVNDEVYTYELGSGNNKVIKRLADVGTSSIFFNAAGGLPASSFTFSRYGAEIIGFNSTNAVNAEANFRQNTVLQSEFTVRLEAGSGVNIDEELANIILFQNAYSASARVITVTGELFDILFEAI